MKLTEKKQTGMCQEVFQILQSLDAQNLDAQLAIQCAPVITGLKLSNLLMVDRCCAGKVEHMLRETGFCCNRVMETTDRTAILVYDFSRLQSYLLQSAVGWRMCGDSLSTKVKMHFIPDIGKCMQGPNKNDHCSISLNVPESI